jgi:hypothetical protein
MYRTEEEKRKLENRIKTTKLAVEELERQPGEATDASSEIEDDWLNLFARLCEDKSSAELQILFGKILSGEVRRPGSFSLRTVQMMATISKSDAAAVSKFLSFSLDGAIVPFQSGDNAPTDSDRLLMEELGVAGHPSRIGGMALNVTVEPNSKALCNGIGLGILIENKTGNRVTFPISGQPVSTSARELIPIANSPKTDLDFLKAVAQNVYSHLQGAHGADVENGSISVHVVATHLIAPNSYRYELVFTATKS